MGLGSSEGGPLACERDPSESPVHRMQGFPSPGAKRLRPKDVRPEIKQRMTSLRTQPARWHCLAHGSASRQSMTRQETKQNGSEPRGSARGGITAQRATKGQRRMSRVSKRSAGYRENAVTLTPSTKDRIRSQKQIACPR